MWKQAKIQFREKFNYFGSKRFSGNAGFHHELALACDKEYTRFIRQKRNKKAIEKAAWLPYNGERYSVRNLKSWKTRCTKRHQWEKHFHTCNEEEKNAYRMKGASRKWEYALYEFLQSFSGWVKLDVRDNPQWKNAVCELNRQDVIECPEEAFFCCYYPVRTVHLTGKKLSVCPKKQDEPRLLNARHHDCHAPEPKKMVTPLQPYYKSLPREIRRQWRYAMWEGVANALETQHFANYVALLDSALKNKLKIMFTPYNPDNNPYANLFWNLACTDAAEAANPVVPHALCTHNADRQLLSWLNTRCLFYPLPAWAYRLLFAKLNTDEAELLYAWSCGKSPRKIFGFSKQENACFHTIKRRVPSLKFALAYCSALANHCHERLAVVLANSLRMRDNSKWSQYLQHSHMLAEWFAGQYIEDIGNVRDLVDYFFRENFFTSDFTLKNRTFKSMMRQMQLWHRELYGCKLEISVWPSMGFSYVLEEEGIVFDEINNAKRLQMEACKQHNCVASYLDLCLKKCCAIVAMNSLDGTMNVTLEINLAHKAIVQAKGKCNFKPSKQEIKYIRQYAMKKHLQYDFAA